MEVRLDVTRSSPSMAFIVIAALFISGVSSLGMDNTCQNTDPVTGVLSYSVCMGQPLKVFLPNVTLYKLDVEPQTATCGATNQFYCPLVSFNVLA